MAYAIPSSNPSWPNPLHTRPVYNATAPARGLVAVERPTLFDVGVADDAPVDRAGALRVEAAAAERGGQKAKAKKLRMQAAALDRQKAAGAKPDPLARTKARIAARPTGSARPARKAGVSSGSVWAAAGFAGILFGVAYVAHKHA